MDREIETDGPGTSRPAQVVHQIDDEASGLTAFLVLDDLTLGPAFGGIRFRAYADDAAALEDARGLARQMTWKCALAGLPAGGGKAVVRADRLVDRRAACEVLGDFIESLDGSFHTAGDLGASAQDIEWISGRTGHIEPVDRLGPLAEAVGLGLASASAALCSRLGRESLEQLTVVIQGLGEIGLGFLRALLRGGGQARVTDLDPALRERLPASDRTVWIEPDQVFTCATDVVSPCAVGGVIDPVLARQLPARAVIGGANRILTGNRAGEILWRRRVLYAPDFLVNAGAVIRGGLQVVRGTPATDAEVCAIGDRLLDLLDEAERRDLPPEQVAVERAERIVRAGRSA